MRQTWLFELPHSVGDLRKTSSLEGPGTFSRDTIKLIKRPPLRLTQRESNRLPAVVASGQKPLSSEESRYQKLWQKDFGTYLMRAGWGTSNSSVHFEGKLFLQIDNQEQSLLLSLRSVFDRGRRAEARSAGRNAPLRRRLFRESVVALVAETGEEIWRVKRDEPWQSSTPITWHNSQRDELVAVGQICRCYDPQIGHLLWQLDMNQARSSATPLTVGDRLFASTESHNRGGSDDGGFLFAVQPGGSGISRLTKTLTRTNRFSGRSHAVTSKWPPRS